MPGIHACPSTPLFSNIHARVPALDVYLVDAMLEVVQITCANAGKEAASADEVEELLKGQLGDQLLSHAW